MEEDWKSWSQIIKACVLNSRVPLSLNELNKDVKMLQGRDIPYRQLNYYSLEELVKSISGLEVSQMNGETVVNASRCELIKFQRRIQKQNSKKMLWTDHVLVPKTAALIRIFTCLCLCVLLILTVLLIFDPNTLNVRNDQTSDTSPMCPALKSPAIPSIGSIFDVHIIAATDPGNFTVQPFINAYVLEILMKELSRFCENYSGPPLEPSSLKVGNMYAAKYDEYGRWYRASVSKILSRTLCEVYFCDYGDYKVLSLKKLRPLQSQFYDLPYQAIQAKLHGIMPKLKSGWTAQDSLRFNELIITKNFVSIIKSHESKNNSTGEMILGLELIEPSKGTYIIDENITNILVNENRASRLE